MALSPRRAVTLLVLLGVVLVVTNVLTSRVVVSWDLTAERSATLSDETRRVLDRVERRIAVTAFFPRDAIGRVEAATLLSRYRKANRRITYRVLDPTLAPGEANRLGVAVTGSAAVELVGTDEVEVAPFTIEIDVTSAIARLLRGEPGTVCFAGGHGERSATDETPQGMSRAASVLHRNGYRTRDADLLADPRVPEGCDAVVVAAPTSSLGEAAIAALQAYLDASGKVLLLADPDAAADLSPVTRPWGITFDRGTVIEADPDSRLQDDVTAPIVRRFSGASPVVRGLEPVFFPRTLAVDAKDTGDPGTTVADIARTSDLSYLDRRNLSSFDPDVDRQGPVPVAAAADSSEVRDPKGPRARILRTRVLAFGDADFASNGFIGDANAANARLWIRGVDWLTQTEALVNAASTFPSVRNLDLTEARSRYMLLLTAGVVPGLFLVAGGFVWVLRRGR